MKIYTVNAERGCREREPKRDEIRATDDRREGPSRGEGESKRTTTTKPTKLGQESSSRDEATRVTTAKEIRRR